ncbi:heme exporter protein CcmD [uncultured Cohaesibacter sp.]|uniref:heme exporter protein CcmD n=1 Tax=uncultured Cohaesibacter sp. TaxID=1002546 RepID=UPI00292EED17|nr:heme exporter protein CcmD [uncultured Cohaesibacter sp.]
MIEIFGKYSGYILASYGISAVTILLLIIWVYQDGRILNKTLSELNERGIRRRSDHANK